MFKATVTCKNMTMMLQRYLYWFILVRKIFSCTYRHKHTITEYRTHLYLIKYRVTGREKVTNCHASAFVIYLYIFKKYISFMDIIIYYKDRENIKEWEINGFKKVLLM